ncbi:hypothetical protein B296_00007533 [Ensete ventricosum]|uniref:Uncharacterized protein n=1 Tax=Ensete ventricosum TaxID=4639 RepID=A0A427A1P4_ENSVE|nr:hypothetical protein B296_00007533 [Ensete ventricosum]
MLLPPGMRAGCQDGWVHSYHLDCDKMVPALDPCWQTDDLVLEQHQIWSESLWNRGKQQRVRSSAALVWVSTSGGRGRWTSVRDRSLKEKQQIWFRIARLDAQAVAEAGLSWPRLPPGRIRCCGCRRGELGVAVVDLK